MENSKGQEPEGQSDEGRVTLTLTQGGRPLVVTFFLPYPWTLPEKVPFIVVGAALYFFRSQPCLLFLQALDFVVVILSVHMCIVVPLPLA